MLVTGSIISDSLILTAAHCPDGADSVSVTLGDTSRNQNEGTEVTVTATRITIHEDWGSVRIINDIALLEVPKITWNGIHPAKLLRGIDKGLLISSRHTLIQTDNTARVCLAPSGSGDFAGNLATVSGWGKQSDTGSVAQNLSYVEVPVITNAECAQTFGATIKDTNICTSTKEYKGTCNVSPQLYRLASDVHTRAGP